MAENKEVDIFDKWLADNTETIQNQYKEGSSYKTYDDGTYFLLFTLSQVAQSGKTPPSLGIKFRYAILEAPKPEDVGGMRFEWFDLEREDAMKWLAIRVKNCGVSLDPADVPALMKQTRDDIFGITAAVTVVQAKFITTKNKETGAEFQNVNIEKHLEGYEVDWDTLKAEVRDQFKDKGTATKKNETSKPNTSTEKTKAEASTKTDVAKPAETSGSDDDEDTPISVGMQIIFNKKSKLGNVEVKGIVTEIDAAEETLALSYGDGKSIVIPLSDVVSVVSETAIA